MTDVRERVPEALAKATFPRPLLEVLATLDRAGHRSWLVGGAVRDLLLHRPREASDFDVATPATPDQVTKLFRKVIPTGVEHGTVTVLESGVPIEVTTFRGEGEYRDGRRPSSVTFLPDVNGDLARRDFTMNAIAWDPIARELRDPFGGRDDLARRVIRAVGEPAQRFAEDGLRPLRAVRFAAQLGFEVEDRTRAAIRPSLPVTAKVALERVGEELGKLLAGEHVALGLELLGETGLLEVALPDVAALAPEARSHAFATAAALAPHVTLRLAALLHAADVARAAAAVQRLRFANAVRDDVAALVAAAGCLLAQPRAGPADDAAARRWLSRVTVRLAPAALDVWGACARSLPRDSAPRVTEHRDAASRIERVTRERPPLSTADLAIDGRAVMQILQIPAGKHVGEALRHLLDRVLEDPAVNTRPLLEDAVRAFWTTRARRG